MTRCSFLLALLIQACLATGAVAHEMRPAYLGLRETAVNEFSALWKVPALGDMRLGLYVRLPETCATKGEPAKTFEGGAYIERWTAVCRDGLKGQEITVDGLRSTLTDALARIEYLDGTTEIARLTPEAPSFVIAGAQTWVEVAGTYFRLGVDHILSGIDHLLFLMALMLLIRNPWALAKTITAFTLAHSITLAGAALGYFSLPQKPVEATIALSITFVASEIIKMKPGERRLSEAYPWVVAFSFGLLHGFGFAGALKEIGLPQVDVPTTLLTFNLGVETGQLLFVAAALVVFKIIAGLAGASLAPARIAAAYLIGSTAAFWLLTRLAAFLA